MIDFIHYCIFSGVLYRFRNGFHSDDLFCSLAAEDADASGAAIKIIEDLRTVELCKLPGDLVELLRLFCIGLKKRFRADLELERLQSFNNIAFAVISDRFEIV